MPSDSTLSQPLPKNPLLGEHLGRLPLLDDSQSDRDKNSMSPDQIHTKASEQIDVAEVPRESEGAGEEDSGVGNKRPWWNLAGLLRSFSGGNSSISSVLLPVTPQHPPVFKAPYPPPSPPPKDIRSNPVGDYSSSESLTSSSPLSAGSDGDGSGGSGGSSPQHKKPRVMQASSGFSGRLLSLGSFGRSSSSKASVIAPLPPAPAPPPAPVPLPRPLPHARRLPFQALAALLALHHLQRPPASPLPLPVHLPAAFRVQ